MNSLTTPNPSTLLQEKLARLVIRLQQMSGPQGTANFQTYEELITQAYEILSQYYQNLSQPLFNPILAVLDTPPLQADYNSNFQAIGDDLTTIFAEYQNLQGVVLGEFNYMVTELNRLQSKAKSIASFLGDYSLTSTNATNDTIFFSDSFNNLQRVEVNSPLLNASQCEVSDAEGIVTLPINRQAQVAIKVTSVPVINSNSNGVVGNNQQAGASLHGTITDILDNNADTWFEYERVVAIDDGHPLLLNLTINLDSPKVVNFIRINPNNFGTRSPVEIVSLDTSYDGKTKISVKEDIPTASFISQTEGEVFTLAPTTSKYAGQGFFTFTPRKAKYVHIVLRQSSSYLIRTTTGGTKFRYAIGIRDIEIDALPFKTTGEVISTNYVLGEEISKVAVSSNQLPDASLKSSLVSINHFVSPDNGVSWYQLRAISDVGESNAVQSIPQVITFNGLNTGDVATNSPVQSLRYKAVLARNSDAFKGASAEMATEIDDAAEMYPIPTNAPFSFVLQKTPVPESIRVIDPRWLGANITSAVPFTKGTGDKFIINLPFINIPTTLTKHYAMGGKWTLQKSTNLIVTINGEIWTEGALTGSSKNYKLYPGTGETPARIEFGDGIDGELVSPNATISISKAYPETLFPEGQDHTARLDYSVANDQNRVVITYTSLLTTTSVVLDKGANQFSLGTNIQSSTLIFSNTTVFHGTSKGNYKSAVANPGEWAFDAISGTLWSFSSTSTTDETTVTFSYYPTKTLSNDDWKFVDTTGVSDAVQISNNVFQTSTDTDIPVPSGQRYFNLAQLSVVPGSVAFLSSGGPSMSLFTEVPYVDGFKEVIGAIQTTEQIGALISGTATYQLKLPIETSTALNVSFSRTDIFNHDVGYPTVPTNPGDYNINRTSGLVTVKTGAAYTNAGTVTYYYKDQRTSHTGYYSINYKTGEVHCNTPTEDNITATYNYTNYTITYNAARLIPSTDWEYDVTNNKVTIADREVLSNLDLPATPGTGGVGTTKFYEVVYRYVKSVRENISELEPFYTPILKDYVLKVIPKSRLY